MGSYPNINNIHLELCCQKTIESINRRLKLGNILAAGLGPAVFMNIFGPSPSTLNTIVAVRQTDFETLRTLVQAVHSIPLLARDAARDECLIEWYRHIGNRKLEQFWKGMFDVFS